MPRWTSICAALALGLAFTACASSADTGFPDPSEVPSEDHTKGSCTEPSEEEVEVDGPILVLDSCFRPQHAVVPMGTEVTWTMEGVAPHNVEFADLEINSHPSCAGDPTQCMKGGESFTATFDEAGEFTYFCVIHGSADGTGMAGTLKVA